MDKKVMALDYAKILKEVEAINRSLKTSINSS